MKMNHLIPVVLFIFSFPLTGQNGQNCPGYKEPKKIEIIPGGIPSIDMDYNIINAEALNDSVYPPACESGKDSIFNYPPEIRSFRDLTIAEAREFYPGAHRFYSKRRMMPSPYEKSFVIKHRPDPRSKYYLIIKDPITHRRTN